MTFERGGRHGGLGGLSSATQGGRRRLYLVWIEGGCQTKTSLSPPSSQEYPRMSSKWDQPAPAAASSTTEEQPPSTPAPIVNGKTAAEAAAAAAAIAAKIAAQFADGTLGGLNEAYSKDIDINDVRNRYMLTRGSTQTEVCLIRTIFQSLLTTDEYIRSTKKLGLR